MLIVFHCPVQSPALLFDVQALAFPPEAIDEIPLVIVGDQLLVADSRARAPGQVSRSTISWSPS